MLFITTMVSVCAHIHTYTRSLHSSPEPKHIKKLVSKQFLKAIERREKVACFARAILIPVFYPAISQVHGRTPKNSTLSYFHQLLPPLSRLGQIIERNINKDNDSVSLFAHVIRYL